MLEIRDIRFKKINNLFLQYNTLEVVIPKLLSFLAQEFEYQWIVYWKVVDDRLMCNHLWKASALTSIELEDDTKKRLFSLGEGMPGRIWRSGRPEIVNDITADMSLPRSLKASSIGLVDGIWFPVIHSQRTYGVIEMLRTKHNTEENDLKFFEELSLKLGDLFHNIVK